MLIKFRFSNFISINCRQSNGFIQVKNAYKSGKFLNCSTDYSKLKPVDLSFIKFDSNDSSKTPIFIYHGLFGSKNNWRSLGRMITDRSNRDCYVFDDTFLRQFFTSSLCERDGKIDWRFNFPVLTDFLVNKLNEVVVDQIYNGPGLLIYGGKSVYFDESHYESVLEVFPKMKFEIVQEGNHYLHISHHEEFLQKLIPFLGE